MFLKSSLPLRPSGDPLYELLRAVRICHPGWEVASPITFAVTPGWGFPWREWNGRIFQPIMRSLLEDAYRAAKRNDGPRLLACDERGDGALPLAMAAGSRREGAKLLRGHKVPAGERVWWRYADHVAKGLTPGHLAVVVAVRAAAFHLPPALLPAAYLFLEARGAHLDDEAGEVLRMVEACLLREASTIPKLRVA